MAQDKVECNELKVGIADAKVSRAPDRIITIGLGSCIGIALYDSSTKLGALIHIMLPDSTQFTKVTNPYKFADLAIPLVLDELKSKGANLSRVTAKIAGGAAMFNFKDKSTVMDIGNRNTIKVKETLKSFSINIKSEDTGGSKGRTIILSLDDGSVAIRTVGVGTKML